MIHIQIINIMDYSTVLHKNSNQYKLLKNNAINDNNRLYTKRRYKGWSKQLLTSNEKMYIFQSCKGRCANIHCNIPLDSAYTVEHIMPKSRHTEDTWKLENLTMLCRSCNSHKSNNHVYDTDNFQYGGVGMSIKKTKQKNWIKHGSIYKE